MREIEFEFIYENGTKEIWSLDDLVNSERSIVFATIRHKRQYTGLKDKNGVKIFEGDIQKLTRADGHYWVYVIEAVGGQFGNQLFSMLIEHNMSVDEDGDRFTFQKIKVDKNQYRNHVKGGKDVEVIGNIYENPKLLEIK